MILIFEQDTRDSFEWIPELYLGKFDKKTTWRLVWGVFSLSYYDSAGLADFSEHIKNGGVKWGCE